MHAARRTIHLISLLVIIFAESFVLPADDPIASFSRSEIRRAQIPILESQELETVNPLISQQDVESAKSEFTLPSIHSTPPAASKDAPIQFTKVAEWGEGRFKAVHVIGTTLFVADGGGLRVLDVANPADIRLLSFTETPDIVQDFAIRDHYAFVCQLERLDIFDIANPANPTRIGSCPLSGFSTTTEKIFVKGNFAYITHRYTGCNILDITNPATPTLVARITEQVLDVEVSGNVAYFSSWYAGLVLYDVSNPAAPTLIGKYQTESNANQIDVNGPYAYITSSTGLLIYDVANPANAHQVAQYSIPNGGADVILVQDGYAILSSPQSIGISNGKEYVLDVHDPLHPTLRGAYYTNGNPCLQGNTLYLACYQDGLEIVELDDFNVDHLIHSYSDGGLYWRIVRSNDRLYISDMRNGLKIFRLTDPQHPALEQAIPLTGGIQALYVKGDRIYTASYTANNGIYKFYVFDKSNPANVTLISEYIVPSYPLGIYIDDSAHAYLALKDRVLVLDVSSPTNIQQLSEVQIPGSYLISIVQRNNWLYVTDLHAGIRILDITNPADPHLENTYYTQDEVYAVAFSGQFGIVTLGSIGFEIADFTNPTAPQPIQQVITPDYITTVQLSGDRAYLTTTGRGLMVYDLSNPTAPQLVGHYFTPGCCFGVDVHNGLAYVADYDGGLEVLDVSVDQIPPPALVRRLSGNARCVQVSNQQILLGHDSALRLLQFDGNQLQLKGSIPSLGNTWSVDRSSDRAYIAERYNGMTVVDVTDPANPRYTARFLDYDFGYGYNYDVVIRDNHAYMAGGYYGLLITNLSNPVKPILVGVFPTSSWTYNLRLVGETAYLCGEKGVWMIDVSDPSDPRLLGITPTYSTSDLEIVGSYAYLATNSSGLKVLDVSIPMAPVEVSQISGSGGRLFHYGRYLYWAKSQQITVIDIFNPKTPVVVQNFTLPGYPAEIIVDSNYLYVTLLESGRLLIFHKEESTPGTASISGKVADASGEPVSGALVLLYAPGNIETPYGDTTGVDGGYSIGEVPTGNYKVRILPPHSGNYISQWYLDRESYETAQEVAVAEGQTISLADVRLAAGGRLAGHVSDSQFQAISNVDVKVFDMTNTIVKGTSTNSDGEFAISGLTSGSFKVWLDCSRVPDYYSEWYNDKADFSVADSIPITAGQSFMVTAQLSGIPYGSISGRITGPDGNGIAWVYVRVYKSTGGSVQYSGTTDSQGNFFINRMWPGQYKIWADTVSAGNYVQSWYDNQSSLQNATIVTLGDYQNLTGVNFSLRTGGIIRGVVRTPQGQAIGDSLIYAYQSSTYYTQARTGLDGSFQLQGFDTGDYKLHFNVSSAPNFISEWFDSKPDSNSADLVHAVVTQTVTLPDVILEPGGMIAGKVTDNAGAGIPSVRVTAYRSSGSSASYANTDNNGIFQIPKLPTDDYKIYFRASGNFSPEYYNDKPDLQSADPVHVVKGEITSEINAVLAPGSGISGRVTDALSGAALQQATVYAYDAGTGSQLTSTKTDASGNYSLLGLLQGSYKLLFYPTAESFCRFEYYENKLFKSVADVVQLPAQQIITGIDAQLEKGGCISGRITDGTGNSPGRCQVSIWCSVGGTNEWITTLHTSSTGDYAFCNLSPGEYRFNIHPTDNPLLGPTWYPLQDDEFIHVAAEQTTTVNISLTTGGAISGSITDQRGNLITGVWVLVRNVQPDGFSPSYMYPTGMGGQYVVPGLPTGEYYIQFRRHENHVSEWFDDQPNMETATPVSVVDGQTTNGIDAELADGGIIWGRVTDMSGNPIENVWVYPVREDEQLSDELHVSTDANGYYLAEGLATGRYWIFFLGVTAERFLDYTYRDPGSGDEFSWVDVVAGQTNREINTTLQTGAMITGRVTGSDGEPMQNQRVLLYRTDTGNPPWEWEPTYTDENGDYRMTPIWPGTYWLYFWGEEGYLSEYYQDAFWRDDATPITLQYGQILSIDAVLEASGGISGRVTGKATMGNSPPPIAECEVLLYDLNHQLQQRLVTNEDGRFSSPYLQAGDYKILFNPTGAYHSEWYNDKDSFESATIIHALAGQPVHNINATLTQQGITGRLTGPTGAAIRAYIYAFSTDSSGNMDPFGPGGFAVTKTDGSYGIGLGQGYYKLLFWPSSTTGPWSDLALEYYNNKYTPQSADVIQVQSGKTVEGIDAQLGQGGAVSGRVTDVFGNPIPSFEVWAYRDGEHVTGFGQNLEGNGYYTVGHLTGGDYTFRATAQIPGFNSRWWQNQDTLETADPIQIMPGQTIENVDFVLYYTGDIDMDGRLTVVDLVRLNLILEGILDPTGGSDIDGNGTVDEADVFMLRSLLSR